MWGRDASPARELTILAMGHVQIGESPVRIVDMFHLLDQLEGNWNGRLLPFRKIFGSIDPSILEVVTIRLHNSYPMT